jgi:hypothetical protein
MASPVWPCGGGELGAVVATPGRMADMLSQTAVSLAAVQYLVLDEADRMLDMVRPLCYAARATTSARYMCGQPGRSTGRIMPGLAGLLLNHTGRATDRMGYKCDIEPLDLRDGGPTTRIHMDGHRGPPAPGACSRSEPTAACSGTGLG